jgi:hypothetical protein
LTFETFLQNPSRKIQVPLKSDDDDDDDDDDNNNNNNNNNNKREQQTRKITKLRNYRK